MVTDNLLNMTGEASADLALQRGDARAHALKKGTRCIIPSWPRTRSIKQQTPSENSRATAKPGELGHCRYQCRPSPARGTLPGEIIPQKRRRIISAEQKIRAALCFAAPAHDALLTLLFAKPYANPPGSLLSLTNMVKRHTRQRAAIPCFRFLEMGLAQKHQLQIRPKHQERQTAYLPPLYINSLPWPEVGNTISAYSDSRAIQPDYVLTNCTTESTERRLQLF